MFLDNVGKLYKDLGKVGFLVVITSTLFLGAGYMFYNMLENMMKQNQLVLETYIKNAQKEETVKHQRKFMKQLNAIPSMTLLLENFAQAADVDHIVISEYHNSIENITTLVPFCKFTSTYEIMNGEWKPMRNEFQNANISNYKSIAQLVHRYYEAYDIEQLKSKDKLLYYQLAEHNAKKVVLCSLEYNNVPWGFIIIIQYSNKYIDVNSVLTLTNEINKVLIQ